MDGHHLVDGEPIGVFVEEHQPNDVSLVVVEDDTFDVPLLVEVTLLVVDNRVGRNDANEGIRRLIGQDGAGSDREDESQCKSKQLHGHSYCAP